MHLDQRSRSLVVGVVGILNLITVLGTITTRLVDAFDRVGWKKGCYAIYARLIRVKEE